jgi:hypothetical protein
MASADCSGVATTNGYKRRLSLSVKQENAIDLLVQGKNDREVAAAIGANRVTVTRWRTQNACFAAELARRRDGVWGCALERLRALSTPALDALEEELARVSGPARARIAVDVLKLVGLDARSSSSPPGSRGMSAEARTHAQVDAAIERLLGQLSARRS